MLVTVLVTRTDGRVQDTSMRRYAVSLLPILLGSACLQSSPGEVGPYTTDSSDETDDGADEGEPTGGETSADEAGADETGADETGSGESESGGDEGVIFDVAQDSPDLPKAECIACSMTIKSLRSGALDPADADVFATAELEEQIVYAAGNFGAGRFIATADASLPFNEVTDCPVQEWMGGDNPSILLFGATMEGDGVSVDVDVPYDLAGLHLPDEYIGNPELLVQDYDIVWYLESSTLWIGPEQPSDEEMETVVSYVGDHGGALYVSSEFVREDGFLTPSDIVSVNRLMQPLGVEALEVDLAWGDAFGEIELDCFPPPG